MLPKSGLKLSVVVPAYQEEGCIESTVRTLHAELSKAEIPHEILVINDNSKDRTGEILDKLAMEISELKPLFNSGPNGFGMAVRFGLDRFNGDCVAIFMADSSDSPTDLVRFYKKMVDQNVDCVFGNRWSQESTVVDYPFHKLILNRLANQFISALFRIEYKDVTNAFKLYRKSVIEGIKPFLSPHYNLTVELPLKAIIRGYSYAILPNDWRNRKAGYSKLKIKEMGSRYLFIVLYCLLEKWLSRGDYKKK